MIDAFIKIAGDLKQYILDSLFLNKDVSIFLCGGASKSKASFRFNLGKAINNIQSKYRYLVYYPEDMFTELILGHQKQDLLTLENLLARSVNAVVILLHSPGTLTELGAFSNHVKLRDKLIVIIDPRYKKAKSFITIGPVRYLRQETKSCVLYHKMIPSEIPGLSKKIVKEARKIKDQNPPIIDLTNPIASYDFYLAFIYVFDPIPRFIAIQVAEILQPDSPAEARISAETVINNLVNQRDALFLSGHLKMTQKGIETLLSGSRTHKRKKDLQRKLSELRIEALNISLRKKRKWGWEGAA